MILKILMWIFAIAFLSYGFIYYTYVMFLNIFILLGVFFWGMNIFKKYVGGVSDIINKM